MIPCPICQNNSFLIKHISKAYINQALKEYYNKAIPNIDLVDYEMYRCDNCCLEFCFPMMPGTDRFYEWIIQQPQYYPSFRWEWGQVLQSLSDFTIKNGKYSLLEAGCGNGDFLQGMNDKSNSFHIGIDTSESAIQACQKRGLNGYCGTIDNFFDENSKLKGSFDFAVSFHCLEHVSDPLSFVKQMKMAVKPGGKLFISTPFSPMSFESHWYDPLNHPPHHMTRWNLRAYNALADSLQMKIVFYSDAADSIYKRTMIALFFKESGVSFKFTRKRAIKILLKKPWMFFREYMNQVKRENINGKPAGNTILVELR